MNTKIQPLRFPKSLLKLTSRDVTKATLDAQEEAPRAARPRWREGFSRDAALDHLEELGVHLADRPDEDPSMPPDITMLSGEDLGRLMAQFVAFGEFLNAQTALAEIAADADEVELDLLEAEIRLRKAGTVADKTAKVHTDTGYIDQQQRCLISKAKAKLLRARTRGYEKCAGALSREQTRRQPYQGE